MAYNQPHNPFTLGNGGKNQYKSKSKSGPSKKKKKKKEIDWGKAGAAAFLGTLGIATAATTIGGGHDSRKKQ
tara:strand:- start:209 stop:424 length:216 start_codon:yes stop_codon:yes gene_type:complete